MGGSAPKGAQRGSAEDEAAGTAPITAIVDARSKACSAEHTASPPWRS